MKKRRKTTKLWVVLALVISLVTVQTVQIIAEASEEPAVSDSPVIVRTMSELISSVENAADGDVIGIDSKIVIDTNVGQIGSIESGKHITILRMNADACFSITSGGNVAFCNMTFEGNNSSVIGNIALFYVKGTVNLNNVTVQNYSTVIGNGGAVFVDTAGVLNADNVVFDGNSGYQGGHIFTRGNAYLNNCTLKNGISLSEGGAVMVSGDGTLDMTNCKVYKNTAPSSGGGIHNTATVTLTRCAVFANTASMGADIANDTCVKAFSMDSIADVLSLYEEEGITPIEWVLDGEGYTDDMLFHFDLSNPNSLMKLIYEEHSSGGSNEGEDGSGSEGNNPSGGDGTGGSGDTPESGGNTEGGGDTPEGGDNTEGSGDTPEGGDNTEGSGDNTEGSGGTSEGDDNTEGSGDTSEGGDNTEGSGDIPEGGNTEGSGDASEGDSTGGSGEKPEGSDNTDDNGNGAGENSGNASGNDNPSNGGETSGDSNSATSDKDSSSTTTNNTTTNNEDRSTTTRTTENHEDKSTTTYNYYTYNTPSTNTKSSQDEGSVKAAPSTGTSASMASAGESEAASVSDSTIPNATDNISGTSAGTQIPDNIKLDLGNVDIVYEMNDGISNIAISNRREAVEEVENAVEVITADQEETAASTKSINWYEVIKMLLLAAIFIVVIPKPNSRKNS